MVTVNSAGSAVTDYGPQQPDPPIAPGAVAGVASISWTFSLRTIERVGNFHHQKQWEFERPSGFWGAESRSFTESSSYVLTDINPTTGHLIWGKPTCTSPAQLPQTPLQNAYHGYVPYQGIFSAHTWHLGYGIDIDLRPMPKCSGAENLSSHSCGPSQKSGCYDFVQPEFAADFKIGSFAPFLNDENFSSTCTESFSHNRAASNGPVPHSFDGYVTSTIKMTYFPADELIANDKHLEAEIKDGIVPTLPKRVGIPPGFGSSNPLPGKPYACSS